MNTKAINLFAAIALFSIPFVSSCKKSDDNNPQSKHDMLVGKWNVTKIGFDSNNNGKPEDNELNNPSSIGFSVDLSLSTNGTAYMLTTTGGNTDSIYGTWSLTDNDQYIKAVDASNNPIATYKIYALDNSNLTVLDTTQPPMWYVFKKQ